MSEIHNTWNSWIATYNKPTKWEAISDEDKAAITDILMAAIRKYIDETLFSNGVQSNVSFLRRMRKSATTRDDFVMIYTIECIMTMLIVFSYLGWADAKDSILTEMRLAEFTKTFHLSFENDASKFGDIQITLNDAAAEMMIRAYLSDEDLMSQTMLAAKEVKEAMKGE